MTWLAIVAALLVGIGAGFILCSVLTLGRVDDVLHALALLVEDPTDPARVQNALDVLRG